MANFKTHQQFGTIVSLSSIGILVSFKNYFSFDVSIDNISFILFFGILGSLLPDIDLKTTIPAKTFKAFIYLFINIFFIQIFFYKQNFFIHSFNLKPQLILFLIILFGVFIAYIINTFFQNQMKHRGIIHSIPFVFLASIFINEFLIFISPFLSSFNINFQRIFVIFIFALGIFSHLLLDEIYSVDFYNKKIKKSFGSALKFFDKKNLYGSFLYYLIIIFYFQQQLFLLFDLIKKN